MLTKRKFLKLFPSSSLLFLAGCSQGEARSGWYFYEKNPVLGKSYGTCFDPYVILENNVFRMWFSWRPKQAIGYSESTDGIQWSVPQIVLAPPHAQTNERIFNRCSVLKKGGIYHIWFTSQDEVTSHIHYATSPDGLKWTQQGINPVLKPDHPWEKTSVMCPDVLCDPQNGTLRLYYSAGEQYEPDGIGLATSSDSGITWEKYPQPIFTSNPANPWERSKVTACNVHYVNGWFYLFYIAFADIDHASICLARSKNGIDNWERHPANPILSAPGMTHFFQWDRDAIYKPAAVMTESGWTLFFNARRHHKEQIGMAIHKGHDLEF